MAANCTEVCLYTHLRRCRRQTSCSNSCWVSFCTRAKACQPMSVLSWTGRLSAGFFCRDGRLERRIDSSKAQAPQSARFLSSSSSVPSLSDHALNAPNSWIVQTWEHRYQRSREVDASQLEVSDETVGVRHTGSDWKAIDGMQLQGGALLDEGNGKFRPKRPLKPPPPDGPICVPSPWYGLHAFPASADARGSARGRFRRRAD